MKLTKIEPPITDTGVRALVLWDAEGAVTYGALPSAVTPRPGLAGGIYIRRRGAGVKLYIVGSNFVAAGGTIPIPLGMRTVFPFPRVLFSHAVSPFVGSARIGAVAIFISSLGIESYASSDSTFGTEISWDSTDPMPTPANFPGIAA